jgi:hypothetical protein
LRSGGGEARMSDCKEEPLPRSERIDFSQAVNEVEQELGVTKAEAVMLLSQAVAEGKIGVEDRRQAVEEAFKEAAERLKELTKRFPPPATRPHPAPADEVAQPLVLPKPQRYAPGAYPAPPAAAPSRGRVELWVHILDEKRWIKVDRADLRRWFDEPAQQAVGKRPRIKSHLAKLYPDGVPDPAFCPRKELRAELLMQDPRLTPLDEATLKTAIDEYNSLIRNDPN